MKKAFAPGQRAIALTLAILIFSFWIPSTPAAEAAASVPVISLDTGPGQNCAIAVNGEAYCWGYNAEGELGDGTTTNRMTPVKVGGGFTWKQIVTGTISSCGITSTDDAYCWGSSYYFNLGNGVNSASFTPVLVSGGYKWSTLSLSDHTTCGILTNGTGACWGQGTSGQVGNTGYYNQSTPWGLTGPWKSISAGVLHSCGVKTDNRIYCWGEGDNGRLGTGNTTDTNTPTLVSIGGSWQSVTAGGLASCAVRDDGAGYCWGSGGSVGDGTFTDRLVPTPVSGGFTWKSISAGRGSVCGVTTTNAGKCWGSDFQEKLGDGPGATAQPAPAAISGGYSWRSLGIEFGHACGVTTDGTAMCWGENGSQGRLGDGTTTIRDTPVLVLLYLVNGVQLTAIVSPLLSFTVSGRSTACNGETFTGSATGSSVNLGRLSGTATASAGQSLSVSTNAGAGSKILTRTSGPLVSSNGGQIPWKSPGFSSFPASGTAALGLTVDWVAAGQWGMTDTAGGQLFNDPLGTSYHCIAYQAQAAANTPAGDYQTTIIYTVVPQF